MAVDKHAFFKDVAKRLATMNEKGNRTAGCAQCLKY